MMIKFHIFIISLFVLFVFVSTDENTNTEEESLKTEIIKEPPTDCARQTKKDDILYMHYIGKLSNGATFDDSHTHTPNEPFGFKLGVGQVIAGWEQGVVGMCIGEKRKLTIPPSLGYGDEGYHDVIPGKSTLIFEIELMDIKDDDGTFEGLDTHDGHTHAHGHDLQHIDVNNDGQIDKQELIEFINKLNDESKENVEDVNKAVEEMIKEHDSNNDGMISFEENQHFAETYEAEHHGEQHYDPEQHQHAFENIDLDNDKFISTDEMTAFLKNFYEESGETITDDVLEKDIKELFEEHDKDKDGKISQEENTYQGEETYHDEIPRDEIPHDDIQPEVEGHQEL